jgi:Fe-S cluster assembly protein SufD
MSSTALQTGFTPEAFEAYLSQRDEPDWLGQLRRAAWQQYEQLPMPGPTDEEWRRTDIRLLHWDQFGPPMQPDLSMAASTDTESSTETAFSTEIAPLTGLLNEGVQLGGHTTSINSFAAATELDPDLAKQGVLFGSLDRLAAQHEALVRPHLMTRAMDPSYDRLAALHASCFSGGAFLYVPRGVTVHEPLHMLSALHGGGVDMSHTLVVLEEGAEATLLAETTSDESAGLHCGGIELILAPGSRLRYVNLQNWGHNVWHFAHQKALVDRDARLQWTIGALGSRLAKVNQHVALVGEGAAAQVNGVVFAEGRQHLCYHTLQHHEAPSCRSDLLYKGALQDRARLVWRGMIKVDPHAQKTDGYQRNDNLVLSDQARADSIPGLEIEADDVICTHGATSGRVDDEQIFYAQSRGLTRNEAVRMIVTGFFQQVFDRITIDSVKEALGHAIGRRIRQYD